MYKIITGKTCLARFVALFTVCVATTLFLIYRASFSWEDTPGSPYTKWSAMENRTYPTSQQEDDTSQVVLVVASQTTDNTTWLRTGFPSWEKAIYLTDAPSNLSVPVNKGREGMVYLRYIITLNASRLPTNLLQATSSTTTTTSHQS